MAPLCARSAKSLMTAVDMVEVPYEGPIEAVGF